MNLTLDELRDLTGGTIGITDVACPLCGPQARHQHNRIRKVMRVWDEGEDFVTYCCQRCGESGYARGNGGATAKKKTPRPAPASAVAKPDDDKAELVRNLWMWSSNAKGTLAETYLRSRRCWIESENIRYLNPRGRHGPTMIARFGEFTDTLTGLHLTRLAQDGNGKAGTEKDKIMLGPSKGQPIIVHHNADRGELIIAEGIEDAASWALATGWSAWAAGSAGRVAAVLAKAGEFTKVFLSLDFDSAGLKALEEAKVARPDLIEIEIGRLMASGEDDANKALIKFGVRPMLDLVLQAQHKAGRISWRRLQRELGC